MDVILFLGFTLWIMYFLFIRNPKQWLKGLEFVEYVKKINLLKKWLLLLQAQRKFITNLYVVLVNLYLRKLLVD